MRATRVTRGTRTYWLIAEDAIKEFGKRPRPEHVEGGARLSVREAVRRSGMPESGIRYRARQGLIRAVSVGRGTRGQWLVAADEVERYEAAREPGGRPMCRRAPVPGHVAESGWMAPSQLVRCLSLACPHRNRRRGRCPVGHSGSPA